MEYCATIVIDKSRIPAIYVMSQDKTTEDSIWNVDYFGTRYIIDENNWIIIPLLGISFDSCEEVDSFAENFLDWVDYNMQLTRRSLESAEQWISRILRIWHERSDPDYDKWFNKLTEDTKE